MVEKDKSIPKTDSSGGGDESGENHLVNFTVNVEHVFNVDSEGKLPPEAMKTWQYYHIEYNLLPNKTSSKADVVMSGTVAKMYSEFDTRLLKTRTDGDKVYVVWSHKHPISVDKSLLLNMFTHTVNVRFWDTKDKVSVRAKFDRPKVFRLPPPPGPKTVDARFDGGGTAQSNARRQLHIEKTTASLSKVKPSTSGGDVKDRASSTDVAGATPTELRKKKLERDMVAEHGKCVLSVPLASLFAGNTCLVASSEPNNHFLALSQVKVRITLNKPLMSENLSRELCPMKLNIVKCKNLPATPVSHQDLSEQCMPVYARYNFLGQPIMDTSGRPHGRDVQWDHQHVLLLGVLSRTKLEEFLTGPAFEVELHDRDRRADIVKPVPKVFDRIGSEGALFDTSGKSKALEPPGVPWDSFGIAKFDLSPLLLGEEKLRLKSPVLPCVRPISNSRALALEPRLDFSESLSPGRYMESGTVLTIELVLAHPLVEHANYLQLSRLPELTEEDGCPFVRLVYCLSEVHSETLSTVIKAVLEQNAGVFNLDNLPEDMYESALSTFKLSKTQERSTTLDYLSGFHVMDGHHHLLVLEGLAKGALERIWQDNPKTSKDFKVLFNSELKFSSRLYQTLPMDLLNIRLFEPLTDLIRHPSLYVRGSVSRDAYDGLMSLCELRNARLMLDCARNNSLPTAEMVKLVAMEFGVPHSIADVKTTAQTAIKVSAERAMTTAHETYRGGRPGGAKWTPIDNYNSTYIGMERGNVVDHVRGNINQVRLVSEENGKRNPRPVQVMTDENVANNYSTSSRNATELAKKRIRGMLREDERYTYSQNYHCQTVSPRSVEEERRKEESEKKAGWKTSKGFLFPGHKTALESNSHGSAPHYSRVEQLREEWQENALHAAILKPTVDWINFSNKEDDFTVSRRLPDPSHPVTIHLAGKQRADEYKDYYTREEHIWRSKLIVENERLKVHRTAPGVELRERGPGAATQVDKAGSILKDPPTKLSLSVPRLRLAPIPAVDVVTHCPVESEEPRVFQPGPRTGMSWSRHGNSIVVPRDDLRGKFNLYFSMPTALSKLKIKPIQNEDKIGHLWERAAAAK